MIQIGSFLNVIDNSGAKKVLCIKLVKSGYKQRYAEVGNIILVSVKSVRFSKNQHVKKGEIHKALVVRTKKGFSSSYYNYSSFFDNSVVLINKQNKLIGTRIFGMIPKKLKFSKFLKLTTLASGLIS